MALRHVVLRPGLPPESAVFDGDEAPSTRHYGAFDGGVAVGCLSLMRNDRDGAAHQLRGMATAAGARGTGVGRALLHFADETLVAATGIRGLWCNARVESIGSDPPRTAGAETFIGQALSIAGTDPAIPDLPGDWPTVSLEAVVARDPDVVVLPIGADLPDRAAIAGERGWRDLPAIREGRVVEIEADLLARPGPGLGLAARALRDALSTIPAIDEASER